MYCFKFFLITSACEITFKVFSLMLKCDTMRYKMKKKKNWNVYILSLFIFFLPIPIRIYKSKVPLKLNFFFFILILYPTLSLSIANFIQLKSFFFSFFCVCFFCLLYKLLKLYNIVHHIINAMLYRFK